jgi:hypothetical protein
VTSPTQFGNSKYFRLRVSGSGTAWRSKHREYVYRPASIWCSPEMVARVPGLPVIAEHPDKGTLDGPEFYKRIVGICILGFVEGDELWAVCRVVDDHAATILTSGFYDTSPSVVFADPDQNVVLKIGDGDDLHDPMIEGTPSFLDHVPGSGTNLSDTAMAEGLTLNRLAATSDMSPLLGAERT